jgi:ribosomal protein S6--L-glutamate ligase
LLDPSSSDPSRPPKNLVALVSGFGWHVQDLLRASRTVGVTLEPVLFTKLVGRLGGKSWGLRVAGKSMLFCDGVLVRMMPPGSLEQVVFRMDALQWFSRIEVPVVNPPKAIERAVDKLLSLMELSYEGTLVPQTWAGESASDAQLAFNDLGGDVVVKPIFGSEGRGIVRVSDPELARRTFRTLERLNCVLYLQKYINNPGHDIRVFVLGRRVLGAIRRYAPPGEWRTNVSLGGRAEACVLEPEVERLAINAASMVGAVIAGVDLMFDLDRNEFLVLEVNAVPGWKALSSATGVDVASEILAMLRDWQWKR